MVDGPRLVLRHYGRVCNYLSSGVLSWPIYTVGYGSLHLIVRAELREEDSDED
jgi:hypothetical protein